MEKGLKTKKFFLPFLFLLLFLPLSISPFTSNPDTIRIFLIILGVSLQFFLYTLLINRGIPYFHSPVFYLLLFHFLWLIIVSLFSPFFLISFASTLFFSLFFLVFILSSQEKSDFSSSKILLFPLPLIILLCFLQKFGLIHWGGRDFSSTIGQKNLFALYLVVLTPFILERIKLSLRKVLWWILLVSLIIALIISHSRSGWLSFFLVIFIFLFPQVKKEWKKRLVFLLSGLFIILLTGIFVNFRFRFLSFQNPHRLTIPFRYLVWKGGSKMFLSRPFIGWGRDTFSYVFPHFRPSSLEKYVPSDKLVAPRAHNEYLQVASEEGIIGEILFLAFWFLVLKELWKRKDNQNLASFSAICGMLFHGLFSVSLRYPLFLFYLYYFGGISIKTVPRKVSYKIRKLLLVTGEIFLLVSVTVSSSLFLSDLLLKKGEKYISGGKYAEGRKFMESALRINSHSPHLLYKLGKARFLTGDYSGALECYKRIFQIAGDYVEIHANMALCYIRLGNYSEALKELTIAEKIHPSLKKYSLMKEKILRWMEKKK